MNERDRQEEVLQQQIEEKVSECREFALLKEIQDISFDYPDWAMGPFIKDDSLTFKLEHEWKDPLNMGWKARAIFNPTTIFHDGKVYLIYRAAPHMETLDSRIGVAYFENGKWIDYDSNPIIYKQEENEVLGCEDPKVYKVGDTFYLFYNSAYFYGSAETGQTQTPMGNVGVDINVATSKDLLHWDKKGIVVPREISCNWAKGAVIPRNGSGEAVKINGEYLMFISEGCDEKQVIGRSHDFITWEYEYYEYCDFSKYGKIAEIACCVTESHSDFFLLDIYYISLDNKQCAAQAKYSKSNPLKFTDVCFNGTYSWGGIDSINGKRMFAQGWEAPSNKAEMYFYLEEKE